MMEKTTIKKIISQRIKQVLIPVTVVLACLVGGCSGLANLAEGDTQNRNRVEMVRLPYMITFAPDAVDLAPEEISQLDHFMQTSQLSYGDEISLDLPLERDGSLSVENQQRQASLARILKERGLHLSPDVTPYGRRPADNEVRFLISRYVVTPPRCGDWSQLQLNQYGNAPTAAFGCANQANLGLMVANPRDLLVGVSGRTSGTEKAAKAVYTYQTKPPTKLSSNKKK